MRPEAAGNGIYSLVVEKNGYRFVSEMTPPRSGPFDAGLGGGTVSVNNATIPFDGMSPDYYLSFAMVFTNTATTTSNGVIQNHIPLDTELVPLIEDDLREVLRDDLAATMTQQSRQMAGYAESALQRLKDESSATCVAQINALLQNEPILFETGSAAIVDASNQTLYRLAQLLLDCDGYAFEVGGHTDNVADDAYNLDLSTARASAVVSALRQRGVAGQALSARGYGETMPIADNNSEEGRQLNRRVEFIAMGRFAGDDRCANTSTLDRNLDATVNQDGAAIDGDFRQETRDCQRDGWTILEGSVSHLNNDQGMSQGMVNLSYRTERFKTQDHLAGRFVGIYATTNDVTGLATGTIEGFGLNAGLYGARRYNSGAYLDYYLGAAAGRHNFNLGFDRSGGVITANGHYTYVAAFAGAAVSGETMLGDYKLSPRAGFEGAWSPGGEADFDVSRGALEQIGSLSTGEVAGLRVFGELRFDDLLLSRPENLAVIPMIFCDRPIGGAVNECGLGLSMALSREDEDTGRSYGIEFSGERTKTSETIGLKLNYTQSLFGGALSGTTSVGRDGQMAVGANYVLDF